MSHPASQNQNEAPSTGSQAAKPSPETTAPAPGSEEEKAMLLKALNLKSAEDGQCKFCGNFTISISQNQSGAWQFQCESCQLCGGVIDVLGFVEAVAASRQLGYRPSCHSAVLLKHGLPPATFCAAKILGISVEALRRRLQVYRRNPKKPLLRPYQKYGPWRRQAIALKTEW